LPRIVGGTAKGRRLRSPAGGVRPATARARQALFDYLMQMIPEARVLDLYCGSGGLGLEALSRGAASAHFVDIAHKSIRYTYDNVCRLGFEGRASYTCRDVFRFLHQFQPEGFEPFDIIFATPPYKVAQPQRIIEEIAAAGALLPGGLVCLEYSRHTAPPVESLLELIRRRKYGETVIEVWERKSER